MYLVAFFITFAVVMVAAMLVFQTEHAGDRVMIGLVAALLAFMIAEPAASAWSGETDGSLGSSFQRFSG